MTGRKRRAGLSLIELTLALGAFGAGTLFLSAAQVETLASSAAGSLQRQAVALAQDQLELISVLPFETLEPTDGFVAPFWVRVPGYFDGELPVGAADGKPRVYRLEWSVTETAETLRSVELRVSWTGADGVEKSHAVDALRGQG